MIDVSELRSLIKHEQQPLTDIEQIFRALIGYPHEEKIRNATRADLTGALDAACEALIGDQSQVPGDLRIAIVATIPDSGPLDATYAWAASEVKMRIDAWHDRLEAAFAGQGGAE